MRRSPGRLRRRARSSQPGRARRGSLGQFPCVDWLGRPRAGRRAGRDRADGRRMIARDDLDRDALGGEVARGVGPASALIRSASATRATGSQAGPGTLTRRPGRGRRTRQHAATRWPSAASRPACSSTPDWSRPPGKQHLGRADQPVTVARQSWRRSTFWPRRTALRALPGASRGRRNRSASGSQRRVAALVGDGKRAERGLGLAAWCRRQAGRATSNVHAALGQGPGLVAADHVDPGQPLDRGQLLDQYPPRASLTTADRRWPRW